MTTVILSVLAALGVVLVAFLLGLLPTSPFLAYLDWAGMNDYLGFINYILPIDNIIVISEAWLLCLAPWIISQLAIKAIKVLGEYVPFT